MLDQKLLELLHSLTPTDWQRPTLDPWAPAAFAVAWAGETESMNWFHV